MFDCHVTVVLRRKTEEQRTAGMEKLRKLRGPKGGELMKPVLTDPNHKRKGSHGDDVRNERGGKRPRQVGKNPVHVTMQPNEAFRAFRFPCGKKLEVISAISAVGR